MNLTKLTPRPGSKHRTKRLGNGESSGKGKTCGKGHKGQKARSGGSIRLGFEGGQMPLFRRMPKRGFNNSEFTIRYAVVNIGQLDSLFESGATIDRESLIGVGLVRDSYDGIKILANGVLTKSFTVRVEKVSQAAKEIILSVGGKIESV